MINVLCTSILQKKPMPKALFIEMRSEINNNERSTICVNNLYSMFACSRGILHECPIVTDVQDLYWSSKLDSKRDGATFLSLTAYRSLK